MLDQASPSPSTTATLAPAGVQLSTGPVLPWTEDDSSDWGWIAGENILVAHGWALDEEPRGQRTLAVRPLR